MPSENGTRIGTLRRKYLDWVLFRSQRDLEQKFEAFKTHCSGRKLTPYCYSELVERTCRALRVAALRLSTPSFWYV